jgi:thiamine biosynthesis lipoprotein
LPCKNKVLPFKKKYMPTIIKNIILFYILLSLTSCFKNEFVLNGQTMGTTYTIKTNKFIDKQIIDNELIRINKIFSNWDKNSEVEKLNQEKIRTDFKASKELINLTKLSQDIYYKTDGYFDITIGNLIDVWGFGVQKIIQKPQPKIVKKALQNSGMQNFILDNNKIIKLKNIKFNFSAIAKGYGVDKIIQLLQKNDVKNGLVEVGGEVRVIGKKTIGIERLNHKPIKITLNNQAIATSGDYRNYKVFNDEKFIHILDPMTGSSSKSDLISVSVIANNTAKADGFATALLAMGKQKATTIIKKYKLKSVLIDKNNKVYRFL